MMPPDGRYAHYRTPYARNNAFVVVVGDDKAETLVEKAAAAFGPLKAEPAVARALAPEPPQMGEKRLVVHRAGGALPIVQAGFHTGAAADPRAPALQALAVALAGGGGGDSASGRSSRLYRALVEKQLATEIDASFGLNKDPFLFLLEATVRPGVTHRAVEDA